MKQALSNKSLLFLAFFWIRKEKNGKSLLAKFVKEAFKDFIMSENSQIFTKEIKPADKP